MNKTADNPETGNRNHTDRAGADDRDPDRRGAVHQSTNFLAKIFFVDGGDDTDRVAHGGKEHEVAEILRWAAEAIIRCHDEYGDIPRDMEICQKTLAKVKRSRSAKG